MDFIEAETGRYLTGTMIGIAPNIGMFMNKIIAIRSKDLKDSTPSYEDLLDRYVKQKLLEQQGNLK